LDLLGRSSPCHCGRTSHFGRNSHQFDDSLWHLPGAPLTRLCDLIVCKDTQHALVTHFAANTPWLGTCVQPSSELWKLQMGNCEPHFNPKSAHFELPFVIAEAAMLDSYWAQTQRQEISIVQQTCQIFLQPSQREKNKWKESKENK
jgi:hypothetical protein